MFTDSITYILQLIAQFMALIVALMLYQWVKEVFASHHTRRIDHILEGRVTNPKIYNELRTFYQWINRMRRRHNLTQEQLAERLGVDPRTVRRWEHGVRPQPRHRNMLHKLHMSEVLGDEESSEGILSLSFEMPVMLWKKYRKEWGWRTHLVGILIGILLALLTYVILRFWFHLI